MDQLLIQLNVTKEGNSSCSISFFLLLLNFIAVLRELFELPLQNFGHLLVFLQFPLVGVVAQGTAPGVQVVRHQVVVGLHFLPTLLPQVQLLPVVEVAPDREYLILKLYGLVPEVPALVHLLEVDELVSVDVELEDLLVKALGPPSSQNVDEVPLGHRRRVGQGEEQLRRKHRPLVVLGSVHFDGAQPLLPVVPPENVYFSVADDGREGAPRSVERPDALPLLLEDVVGLTARHPLALAVVPANHIHFPAQEHAGVLLPGVGHRLLFLQNVLLPRRIEEAVAAGASPGYENFPRRKSTGRSVVLYFAVVDGGEGVDVVDGAKGEQFLPLPEKADLRGDFVANLDKGLIPRERHDQDGELYHRGLPVLLEGRLLDLQVFFSLFLLLDPLETDYHSRLFLGVVVQVDQELLLLILELLDLLLQEFGQFFFAPVVLIAELVLDGAEDAIELFGRLGVAPDELLLDVLVLGLVLLQRLFVLVEPFDFGGELLLGHEKRLVLLDEVVAGVVDDALDADVLAVSLAVELVGFVVDGAELVVAAELFFLAGQLESDEVFGEHVGFDLGVVLIAAGGAVQEFLLLVNDVEALFADSVAAVEIAGDLHLGVVEVVTHRAFHSIGTQELSQSANQLQHYLMIAFNSITPIIFQ